MSVVDVASWACILIGVFFTLTGAFGMLRLPDVFTRMHAASITDSIGPILVLGGLILQSGLTLATVKLIAILIFLLLTGPTASNALAVTIQP